MPSSWPARDVSAWSLAGEEQQGMHPHRWLRHESETRTWLFKPARAERARSLPEDIAERLACGFAGLLRFPAARVELATRHGGPGVIVEDARWAGGALQHGQVLMTEVDEHYDPDDREHRGHSVVAIRSALARFDPPPGADVPSEFTGFDVFSGYLVFDGLIAHVDRHDRNWAVLVRPPGEPGNDALCASFDHAACLGFTLAEEAQARHLQNRSVAEWAGQGRASRFEHQRGTRWASLVDLAASAVDLCSSDVRAAWHNRLEAIERDAVDDLVGAAPRLSEVTRLFIAELVMVNRRRLLDVLR